MFLGYIFQNLVTFSTKQVTFTKILFPTIGKALSLWHEKRFPSDISAPAVAFVPATARNGATRRHHLCPDGGQTPSRLEHTSRQPCLGVGRRPYFSRWRPHHGFCSHRHGGILQGRTMAQNPNHLSARHAFCLGAERRQRYGGRRLRKQFRRGANLGHGALPS